MKFVEIFAQKALAAALVPVDPGGKTLGSVANTIIDSFLVLAAIIAVGAVIYSGTTYITSAGNPEKVQKATKSLTWSIVGLILIILAYTIINVLTIDIVNIIN